MMDTRTVQFVYRAVAITVCGCIGAFMLMMVVAVFVYRDGEGIAIINDITKPLLGILSGMVAALGLHQYASWRASASGSFPASPSGNGASTTPPAVTPASADPSAGAEGLNR